MRTALLLYLLVGLSLFLRDCHQGSSDLKPSNRAKHVMLAGV